MEPLPADPKAPKAAKVKNKNAAPIQITAEQILREAKERQDAPQKVPKQRISDPEELDEFKLMERKKLEDTIRMNKSNFGAWIRYAQFEENLKEFERARSVFERALNVDGRNQSLYMKYAEMEMKNKFINHARNVYDRAVTILPRVDQFWFDEWCLCFTVRYKYAYMEEKLENVAGARQVFERWMKWEPNEDAWNLYIKLEKRYKETERARQIFRRFIEIHPLPKNWLKWAKFEEDRGEFDNVRHVLQQAIDYLGEENADAHVFIAFARFEIRMKEYERARAIFKFGLDKLPKALSDSLYKQYSLFEKQYGQRDSIEDVVATKRRLQYEEELKTNPTNYDVWFDLIRLEEGADDFEKIREIYERAIANVPPVQEKRYWRRYMYLWINYAVFEELTVQDPSRARNVYLATLDLLPHRLFTFAKIWLLYAKFELRQMNLLPARKALGRALGQCPKEKLFKGYIELELELREFDRCRTLYQQFLKFNPSNCFAWIKFCELERLLDDLDRARALYELSISQPQLDMPEVLWKSYIDFEFSLGEWAKTRTLYKRLLLKSQHPKVWASMAEFESVAALETFTGLVNARTTFEQGVAHYKVQKQTEERTQLLHLWIKFEEKHNDVDLLATIRAKLPQQVKKRRKVAGEEGGWEEYYDLVFPDDEEDKQDTGISKLLAMSRQWKQSQK